MNEVVLLRRIAGHAPSEDLELLDVNNSRYHVRATGKVALDPATQACACLRWYTGRIGRY